MALRLGRKEGVGGWELELERPGTPNLLSPRTLRGGDLAGGCHGLRFRVGPSRGQARDAGLLRALRRATGTQQKGRESGVGWSLPWTQRTRGVACADVDQEDEKSTGRPRYVAAGSGFRPRELLRPEARL